MTLKNKREDERKKHRIATYLSESENVQIRNSFEQSDFTNFSQYHRYLIISATSEIEHPSMLTAVNEATSYALSETVHAITSFLTQLEKIEAAGCPLQISELINSINGNVLYVGDVCYRWAKWYRDDAQRRQIIKDIAELTLSSNELVELAKTVKRTEEKL